MIPIITIDTVSNNGSLDWTGFSYDISNLVFGNDFKLVLMPKMHLRPIYLDGKRLKYLTLFLLGYTGIRGGNSSAIGPTSADYTVAARWDANTLNDIDGDTIEKLKFFIFDIQFDYLILHI